MKKSAFSYVFIAVSVAAMVITLAPLAIMAGTSFNDTGISFPPDSLTLKWCAEVLGDQRFITAIGVSLMLAVVSTLISLVVGLVVALAIRKSQSKFAEVLSGMMLSPLFLPGALLGIALYQASYALLGSLSLWVLLLGHMLLTMPFPVRAIMAGLARVPAAVEEAAALSGASFLSTVWHVLLPQLRMHIFAGSALAFTMSWNDFDLSLFLSGTMVQTLPVELYGRLQLGADPSITALSVIVALISIVGIIILDRTMGVSEFAGIQRQSSPAGPKKRKVA